MDRKLAIVENDTDPAASGCQRAKARQRVEGATLAEVAGSYKCQSGGDFEAVAFSVKG